MQTPTIRLLASTNNARGDLFTRLAKDLFFALGYDDLRLDVQKSGREIDIRGTHRFELREVLAECKSEREPIGGRDANTFLGVLTRERDKSKDTPINGYFVSLSGFRETEVEQELQTSANNRIILLNGAQVVQELERSRLLVSRDHAVERAGRCAEYAGITAVLEGTELLAHQTGYVWAVYYSQGKERTHVALIYADGTPLAQAVAREVVGADRKTGGSLYQLNYIGSAPPPADRRVLGEAALARYVQWIEQECGFIQLDGLPADTDLSATRMKLERLFVPLKVAIKSAEKSGQRVDDVVVPVGEILKSSRHLALVAKPGGGKSTLLKRLAIAYAFPSRRTETDDELPEGEWLPLFLRCRELRDRSQRPIVQLLDDLPMHAGMNEEETAVFREQIHEALRSGKALLLVDGLDEISDEGSRGTFAQHLRTFVAMFPNAAIVVTSREAGFRLIAGVIASVCVQARIAPFDEADVQRLCERWHVEVIANSDKVRFEARELAETIWNNERIRLLAENPLMLTTLLVVRRCIGELPTRRVELYREAVRVLIRTWNTEGFAPLDLDEALAQLSYVACAMTEAGRQQIARKSLIALLRHAREELIPELQFTQVSPEQFIERIEYRSSLLMQAGFMDADGEVQPAYEFRHLTFQEYLTARGLVEEQYPGRDKGSSVVELLEPHFNDEGWREIVPLAAVMAGRRAEQTIIRLTTACDSEDVSAPTAGFVKRTILRQCLLDEVQVTPTTLRAALDQTVRDGDHATISYAKLRTGKFAALFEQVVNDGYFSEGEQWQKYVFAMSDVLGEDEAELERRLLSLLVSGDRLQKTRAALACMNIAFRNSPHCPGVLSWRKSRSVLVTKFEPLRDALSVLVGEDDLRVAFVASWALAWVGAARLPNSPPSPDLLRSLYRLWRSQSGDFERFASWAFERQPLLPRGTFTMNDFPEADELFIKDDDEEVPPALIILSWYRRGPWNDNKLLTKIAKTKHLDDPTIIEILRECGSSGEPILERFLSESALTRACLSLLTFEAS